MRPGCEPQHSLRACCHRLSCRHSSSEGNNWRGGGALAEVLHACVAALRSKKPSQQKQSVYQTRRMLAIPRKSPSRHNFYPRESAHLAQVSTHSCRMWLAFFLAPRSATSYASPRSLVVCCLRASAVLAPRPSSRPGREGLAWAPNLSRRDWYESLRQGSYIAAKQESRTATHAQARRHNATFNKGN